MNFGLLLFVTALFSSSCMSSDPSHESINNDNFGRKKLADLNGDVLSIIFDQLELMDMVKLLDVYPAPILHAAAKSYFWRKYKDYEVYIKSNTRGFGFYTHHKNMEVNSVELGIKTVQLFGDLIRNLKLYDPPADLCRYINEYTSESITKLSLGMVENSIFVAFTKPFQRVEKLSFNVRADIKTGNLSMSYMFPNLRQLIFSSSDAFMDYNFMIGEYPHLEYLHIPESFSTLDKIFKAIVRKNPHIRSISVDHLTDFICDVIRKYVPTLESLRGSYITVKKNTTFENVKHFDVIIWHGQNLDKLSFPFLESVQFAGTDRVFSYYNEFCKRHQHVTHFRIYDFRRAEEIIQLTGELPNLNEITLHSESEPFAKKLKIETITDFIGRNPKLVKFNFVEFYAEMEFLEIARERLENDWEIFESHVTYSDMVRFTKLSFEKLH